MEDIRILFTPESEVALEKIVATFQLQEDTIIAIAAKEFARGNVTIEQMAMNFQSDLEVSESTAQSIAKEVINTVVPLLQKVPEKEFRDPSFVEVASEQLFSKNPSSSPSPFQSAPKEEVKEKILPKAPLQESSPLSRKPRLTKNSPPLPSIDPPQEPQPKKQNDSYREPLE